MRMIAIAAALAVLSTPARATAYESANRAASLLASIQACGAKLSVERKSSLYSDLLAVYDTAAVSNYLIDNEVTSINKMSADDKAASAQQ
jgi:hypothetical protein